MGALSYDGENRLTSYDNNVASLQEQGAYAYDRLGQRVKRTTPTGGTSETTVYVYDAFGQLAAEYSSVAPAVGSGGTFYRTEDHLGSTRLVTKQDQTVAECRDFFPFGERIGSGLNGRSLTCYGGTGDVLAQQFTGKERDKESSLDYFGARYYSARLGRFVSPDAPFADQFASAPQSWSLYGYVRNNPLRFFDPTGNACVVREDESTFDDDSGGQTCAEVAADDEKLKSSYTVTEKAPTVPTAQERFWQRSQPDRPLTPGAYQVIGTVARQTKNTGSAVGAFAVISFVTGTGVSGWLNLGKFGRIIYSTIVAERRVKAAQLAWNKIPYEAKRPVMNWLSKIGPKSSGSPGPPPAGYESILRTYRDLSRAIINVGRDNVGSQAKRIAEINKYLPKD